MIGHACAVLTLALLMGTGDGPARFYDAHSTGNSAFVGGWLNGSPGTSARPVGHSASEITYEFERRPPTYCGTLTQDRAQSVAPCVDDTEDAPVLRRCDDGTMALAPLFRRALDADTGEVVEGWRQVDNGGCPEDPAVEVVLSAEEFRRLPLVAAEPMIQPSDGRALVTKGVAVHTDGSPQELATTVLGVPVVVRATPVQFAWDFGDGTPVVVTTQPGQEYPHHAWIGEYPQPGVFELRLTTSWRGEFQVAGTGPWLPVTGTATTTSAPVSITVETAPARLYADR